MGKERQAGLQEEISRLSAGQTRRCDFCEDSRTMRTDGWVYTRRSSRPFWSALSQSPQRYDVLFIRCPNQAGSVKRLQTAAFLGWGPIFQQLAEVTRGGLGGSLVFSARSSLLRGRSELLQLLRKRGAANSGKKEMRRFK